jgi:hypothetical protein
MVVSGYIVAAGTGAFRIINDKHWLSDVLLARVLSFKHKSCLHY